MASNRDRLRSMSKKNTEMVEQMKDVPTLISDVAERDEEEKVQNNPVKEEKIVIPKEEPVSIQKEQEAAEIETEKDLKVTVEENIKNKNEENLNNKEQEPSKSEPNQDNSEQKSDTPKNKPDNNINSDSLSSNKISTQTDKDTNYEEPAQIQENNSVFQVEKQSNVPKKRGRKNSVVDIEKKYEGEDISISLLLSDDLNEYLNFRPIELNTTTKNFFTNLLINEIENGSYEPNGLARYYQRIQRDTVKKSIRISKKVVEAVKQTAPKYRMRYTAFMSYVINKEMLRDTDYTRQQYL